MLLLVSQVCECVVVVLLCCDDALYCHTIVIHAPHWVDMDLPKAHGCIKAWNWNPELILLFFIHEHIINHVTELSAFYSTLTLTNLCM